MTESLTTRNVTEILKSYIEKIALDLDVSESTLQRSFDPLLSNLSGISAGGASIQDAFTNVQVAELSNAVTYLEQLIKESLGDVIVEGFFVRPTDPPSDKIRVYPGVCYVSGRRLEFSETVTFTIDLQSGPRTHFVYMKSDGVLGVSPFLPDEALALAKIEKPSSYAKVVVEDHDFVSKDAYIVSGRDALFDNNTLFDDQTKAELRNITSEILAKNLIGTIVVSESLRIQNTQGSLDMDSREIRIKDPQKNILSKFNANGVFFYSSTGEEFSHFGRNNARVGNIKITPNSLESVNFSAGAKGFQIKSDGDAEFNNVKVRGHIEATSGTIDGWSIQTGKLTGGNVDLDSQGIIRVGIDNNIGILDSTHLTHRFWIGHQTAISAPFSVTKEGALKSISGEIGGFSIGATSLSAQYVTISSLEGGKIELGGITFKGQDSSAKFGTGITLSGVGDGTASIGSHISMLGANSGRIEVGSSASVVLDGVTGSIIATIGQIGGWSLTGSKLFSTNIDIVSEFGGSIRVGDILLTGSTSKIDVGTGIDILGAGSGRIDIASVIDINGGTGTITLSGGGSFVAGDATLNSQGLVINGTYSSVSVGTGNSIIKLNNTNGIYLGHSDQASAPFSVTMQGVLKSVSGQIGGWDITSTKLSSTNVELKSDSGGSIKVGNITLTGATSKIDVGLAIDIDGSNHGLIKVGTGITIDGEHQKITLTNTGSLIAGDATLNSQGLTISGTYSSISLGTGNNVIRINNSDGIYLGHTTKTSAPFWVNMQGDLVSTSGSIGNWSITSSTLRAPSDAIVLDATNKRIDIGGKIRLDGLNERAESTNFQSGIAGWRLDGLGNAEFQNAIIRGRLHTSVFVKDEVHASNGQLLVTDATTLQQSISSSDTKLYISDGVFLSGDRLRMKTGLDKDELLKVTGTGQDGGGHFVNVTRNLDGNGAYSWDVGTAVVSVESRISLVASGSSNLPYIDAIERTSDSNEISRARFGNLAGISGANGYGLWSENVFLSGKITATSGAIAGWVISGSQMKSDNDKIVLDSALKKITANTIVIDGENNRIDVGSFIDLDGSAGGKIIVGSVNDVYLDGALGKIFAKKGEVGGWILSSDSLKSDSASTPVMTFLAGSSARITITDGSQTQVILGKYDGSNYGLQSGDATLNSSGLTISGTSSSISIGTGNSILKLNNSNGIYLGNSSQALAPFSVTMAGYLKTISGLIGGWTLDTTKLSSTNVELNSSSGGSITIGDIIMSGSNSRIDVGSEIDIVGTGSGSIQVGTGISIDGANQRITLSNSGQFVAGDATLSSSGLSISGTSSSISLGTLNSIIKINNSDGLFLGNAMQSLAPFSVTMAGFLKALSGNIGGWSISSSQISSSNILLNSSGILTIGIGNDVVKLSSVDGTYRLWAGHDSSSSAPFKVKKDGHLFASNADIQGHIKATSGYFGTASNGWDIDSNKITAKGSGLLETSSHPTTGIKLDISSLRGYDGSNQRFKLGTDGSGFLGSSSTFSWTTGGSLTIGGFNVGNSSLTAGSGSNSVGVSASGTYAFYAGNTTPSSAPFRVNFNGQLNASNAVISGDFVCNILTATTQGNIAGWDISASALTANSGSKIQTSSGASSNGIILDNSGLRGYGSSVKKFELTASNGRVFATEADIGRKIVKITSTSNVGTAINDAISYFGSEGGIIYIPDGTYRVNTTINLADNITIKGAGPTRTKLEPSTNLGNMFNISWNVDNVEISDLELRGKNVSYGGGPYTASYCIRVTASGGIDNIRLRNCSFRDAQVTAVDFSYAGRELIESCIFSVNSGTTGIYGATNVLNCEFSGSGMGVNGCATVKNCEFNNMGTAADSVLHLENNRFFNCSTCYYEGTYSERTLIQNNLFKSFSSYGVRMNSRNFNAIIANNIFQSGSGTMLAFERPFGISVTNNNFFECNGTGIDVDNYSTETYERPCIYIKGNNFYRCNMTRYMDVNLGGYPAQYNSCDISNNGFHHCKGSSLYFIETYDGNATICNNLIVGPEITSTSGTFVGIEVSDNYNTVVGNVISNLKVPSGFSGSVKGIYDISRHSTIVGNSISMIISSQYDIWGIYNWGGSYNYTVYVGNNLQIQNSGSGIGKAFKVNITEGTAVGNQMSNSDSNGDLSISSGVVANNSMV